MTDRQAYRESVEAKLAEITAEIDKLKAQAKSVKADARLEMDEQISHLFRMRDAALDRMDELERAGDRAWEDIQVGLRGAINELRAASASVRRRFFQDDP